MVALIAFLVIDLLWLAVIAAPIYDHFLGELLRDQAIWPAAGLFYLLFVCGLVYFAINPALKKKSLQMAVKNGALFGFFTYMTYELTNYATLRNWTLNIAVIDCLYGAFIGLAASATTFLLAPPIARWLGIAVP